MKCGLLEFSRDLFLGVDCSAKGSISALDQLRSPEILYRLSLSMLSAPFSSPLAYDSAFELLLREFVD